MVKLLTNLKNDIGNLKLSYQYEEGFEIAKLSCQFQE